MREPLVDCRNVENDFISLIVIHGSFEAANKWNQRRKSRNFHQSFVFKGRIPFEMVFATKRNDEWNIDVALNRRHWRTPKKSFGNDDEMHAWKFGSSQWLAAVKIPVGQKHTSTSIYCMLCNPQTTDYTLHICIHIMWNVKSTVRVEKKSEFWIEITRCVRNWALPLASVIKRVNSETKDNAKTHEIQWLLTQLAERSVRLSSAHHGFNEMRKQVFSSMTKNSNNQIDVRAMRDALFKCDALLQSIHLFVSGKQTTIMAKWFSVFGSFCRRLWRCSRCVFVCRFGFHFQSHFNDFAYKKLNEYTHSTDIKCDL